MPAKGQIGWHHSLTTRKKIGAAVRLAYDEGRAKQWLKGTKGLAKGFRGQHTQETKDKISKNRKGKALGNKNGFKQGQIPWNKGKPHPVHNAEWRKKASEANSGPNHWNWKGGIASENRRMRNSALHKNWMHSVFARDFWICQKCGYRGRQLTAHHISPWSANKELRFTVSNGITLCRSCHCALHKPRTGTGKPPKRQSV